MKAEEPAKGGTPSSRCSKTKGPDSQIAYDCRGRKINLPSDIEKKKQRREKKRIIVLGSGAKVWAGKSAKKGNNPWKRSFLPLSDQEEGKRRRRGKG